MVAEGKCQIYPRIGPTMEWDIAAGHAVAEYAKCSVIDLKNMKSMVYNKENLINPDFIVLHPLLTEVIKSLIE
jgi:3'(2'), 5'-bisphosphate nucleotidase